MPPSLVINWNVNTPVAAKVITLVLVLKPGMPDTFTDTAAGTVRVCPVLATVTCTDTMAAIPATGKFENARLTEPPVVSV